MVDWSCDVAAATMNIGTGLGGALSTGAAGQASGG
jgi:hypothetical protein